MYKDAYAYNEHRIGSKKGSLLMYKMIASQKNRVIWLNLFRCLQHRYASSKRVVLLGLVYILSMLSWACTPNPYITRPKQKYTKQSTPTPRKATQPVPRKVQPLSVRSNPPTHTHLPRKRPPSKAFTRGQNPIKRQPRHYSRMAHPSYSSAYSYRYYLQGRLHAIEKRRAQAIQSFKSALVYHPTSSFLRFCIAEQYAHQKQFRRATFWLKQAIRIKKKYASAYHLLGRISVQKKQPKKAIAYFRTALKQHPTFAKAYIDMYATLEQQARPIHEKKAVLNTMLKHLPQRFEGYYFLGVLKEEQGKLRQAIRYYRKALNRNPSHYNSLLRLGHIYENKKDIRHAIRTYHTILDYQPNAWSTRIALACLFLKRKKPHDTTLAQYQFRYIMQEAIHHTSEERAYRIGSGLFHCNLMTESTQWLKRALSIRKMYPEAQLALGIVYNKLRRWSAALVHLRHVSPKKKTLYIEAQAQLVRALLHTHSVQDAWLTVERARIQLAQQPKDWIRIAQIYIEHAPQAAIQRELQQLLQQLNQLPNHEELLHLIALTYYKKKHFKTCEKYLLRILKNNAKHGPSLNFLGYVYAERKKNLKRAEKLIKRALRITPNNAYYLDSLGWVYYQKRAYNKARKVLERAVRQLPYDPTVLHHLARVYHRQRMWKKARYIYLKALRLKPSQTLQIRIQKAIRNIKRYTSRRKVRRSR